MWQENEEKKPIADNSDMAELSFSVDCKELPYDHAYELSSEILNLVPEIKNIPNNFVINSFLTLWTIVAPIFAIKIVIGDANIRWHGRGKILWDHTSSAKAKTTWKIII